MGPALQKTLSERVNGDLVEAIVRARQIDSQLTTTGVSGAGHARLSHEQLVAAYLQDLRSRSDAGEIDPNSVERYRTPLERHYLEFVVQPSVARRYRQVARVDRIFRLEFSQFLQSRLVTPNGSVRGDRRPMRGQAYVLDVVRSMLHWAADQERGGLLPVGFQNPFARVGKRSAQQHSQVGEPDITIGMAAEFFAACDDYQLPIFATLALYGLRPDELGWIFKEDITTDWLRVGGQPDLFYETKGRRDKQFPIIDELRAIWPSANDGARGLLFTRRQSKTGSGNASKESMVESLRASLSESAVSSAAKRRQTRDRVLREFGQLRYDDAESEFTKVAKLLKWPSAATLKDLRHLFATSLENAGVPESYRRFLMGHSSGRAAIVTYTHLNKVREHFLRAIETEFRPLVAVVKTRARD